MKKILFQGFKLETPSLGTQNERVETSKPQDDWQRQVEFFKHTTQTTDYRTRRITNFTTSN